MGPEFFAAGVDVMREALCHQKPEHVRGQNERPMVFKCQVDCRHDGVEVDAGCQLAVVARTGLDCLGRLGDGLVRLPGPLRKRLRQQSLDRDLIRYFR